MLMVRHMAVMSKGVHESVLVRVRLFSVTYICVCIYRVKRVRAMKVCEFM